MFWFCSFFGFNIYAPVPRVHRVVLFHLTTPVWFSETNWDEKKRIAPVLWCGAPSEDKSQTVPRKTREEVKPEAIKTLERVLADPDAHPIVLLMANHPDHFDLINNLVVKHGYRLHTNQFCEGVYHVTLVRYV